MLVKAKPGEDITLVIKTDAPGERLDVRIYDDDVLIYDDDQYADDSGDIDISSDDFEDEWDPGHDQTLIYMTDEYEYFPIIYLTKG